MTPYRGFAACLAIAVCLLAISAAWAADPASVMPADLDYYVALDLDAAQQAADQILPQLSQDYWAKSQQPGAMGLAVLAAAAPVIHAQLTTVKSMAGARVAVGVFEFADLYGAYANTVLEMMAEPSASNEKPPEKAPSRPQPLDVMRKVLPHLDAVVALEISDPAGAKPLLDALQAKQKRKRGKKMPPLAVHVTDKWVVIATKPARLEQVKAVMEGKQPALASHAAYREIIEALPQGRTAFLYANPAQFGPEMVEHARALMKRVAAEAEKRKESEKAEKSEEPQPEQKTGPGPMIEAVMQQYMAFYWSMIGDYYAAVRGAGVGYYLARDKVEQREVYLLDPAKMAQVPLLGRVAEPVPMTGAALGALPATSLAAFTVGGAGKQAGALLAGAAELDPSLAMFVAMGKAMLGGFLGLDLDEDLLPAMERDFAVGVLALDMTDAPPVQVALALQGRDEAAASGLAAKLDALATERLKTKIERGTIGSVAFRQFSPPKAPFAICYAQVGDLLVVATGKEALEACLAARADRRLSLAGAPEIEALMESAGSAAALGFVRGGRIVSQAAPMMPPKVKAVIGDGIGLDWLAFAVGGDAERQMLVSQMRGDLVTFAETVAQAAAIAVREGLLRPPKPRPPAPEPATAPMPKQPH